MELQQTASAVSSCSTDEDPPEWDPDELLEYAEKMGQLKERIFEKAKANIDEAQKKDKQYYDRKHSNPEVRYITVYIYSCTVVSLFHWLALIIFFNHCLFCLPM